MDLVGISYKVKFIGSYGDFSWTPKQPKLVICITFWIQSCYFGYFGGHEKSSYRHKNRFRKSSKVINPKLGEIKTHFTKNWILGFWNPKSVFAVIWRFFLTSKPIKIGHLYHIFGYKAVILVVLEVTKNYHIAAKTGFGNLGKWLIQN